jgi:hypothetical protein
MREAWEHAAYFLSWQNEWTLDTSPCFYEIKTVLSKIRNVSLFFLPNSAWPSSVFRIWATVLLSFKHISCKQIEIKYVHTYEDFKGTEKILKKNMMYFELHKKIKSWQLYAPIHIHKFIFSCSLKYSAISTETLDEYSGYVYVFME